MTMPPSTLASPETVTVTETPAAPVQRTPLLAFLRKPSLPDRATGLDLEGLLGVLRLYAVDFAAMCVLAALALVALATGFEFPSNSLNEITLTSGVIALIVLGAPLMEELAFRSWLSGRPGHWLALLVVGAGLFVMTQTDVTRSDAAVNFKAIGAALVTGAAAIASIYILRGRPPFRWFAFSFPVVFWLVTLAFALVHLANYTEGTLLVLLPLVIPQFIAGALFGYARVQYGLWAAMLLHAMHNGTAVALVLLLGEMLPGTGAPA